MNRELFDRESLIRVSRTSTTFFMRTYIYMSFLLCQYGKFAEVKNRNIFLTRNINEVKALNMKCAKPKTYRDEMSYRLMKMTLSSESLQLHGF